MVCFKAVSGYEWRHRESLEAAGVQMRQFSPAQTETLGRSLELSPRPAELIVRFMAFRSEATCRMDSRQSAPAANPTDPAILADLIFDDPEIQWFSHAAAQILDKRMKLPRP